MLAGAPQQRDPRDQRQETRSAVSALIVHELERDMQRVAIPRPETHLVVRFGPSVESGLDVHALGVRQKARRKLLRRGQRSVMARIHLGAHVAVLGVPASAVAGRIVDIEDLWGKTAANRLRDRLAQAPDTSAAAVVLQRAIAERIAHGAAPDARTQLTLACAELLRSANIKTVARKLSVSERHLRRVFRETLGVSPKSYARLERFHAALAAAQETKHATWADIAADSGYYDQAHMIAEFRGITGVTPRALLQELRAYPSI